MNGLHKSVVSFLKDQNACVSELNNYSKDICKIIEILIKARDKGKTVFTMGNGGSGSTASHFVSDLLKTSITKKNNRFKAISLVDNMPVLLAWSNDSSYKNIFSEQLRNFISNNDVIIAFSGSGNSQNIIKALQFAKKNGAYRIGFSGKGCGKMKNYCNICLEVPSKDMLTIESLHLMICHCIIATLRNMGIPLFKYE